MSAIYPKIELHVHLEGSVRPELLLAMAKRNDVSLPVSSVEGLRGLFEFRGFAHFIEVYKIAAKAMKHDVDFVDMVRAYTAEAASYGAVYLELIFAPINLAMNGTSYDEIFAGFCDGAQAAQEESGIDIRLTPDIGREYGIEEAWNVARHAMRHQDRGIVGLGLGGLEAEFPPEAFQDVFNEARSAGLASVPHAGEAAGARSVWSALEYLGASRIRHGVRSIEDPKLVRELADRSVVLDVCLVSNLRTRIFSTLEAHPLPELLAAGVACTVNTDDPALFDTDLGREHAASAELGVSPEVLYEAGVKGALCDQRTRQRLKAIGEGFDWTSVSPSRNRESDCD